MLGFEAGMMRYTQLLIVDEIEDFSVVSLKWEGLDHSLNRKERQVSVFWMAGRF